MDVTLDGPETLMSLFDWASLNVATRCFGHPQVPNDLAMIPFADLINHDGMQLDLVMYVTPESLNRDMMTLDHDTHTEQNEELESYFQARGFRDLDCEENEEYLYPDSNCHEDEYPNNMKYYNYMPEQLAASG